MNIASIFALSGKKTLLIGADLRKPKLDLEFETEAKDEKKEVYQNKSIDQLDELLTKAVANEDYETAAKIRDEISKR